MQQHNGAPQNGDKMNKAVRNTIGFSPTFLSRTAIPAIPGSLETLEALEALRLVLLSRMGRTLRAQVVHRSTKQSFPVQFVHLKRTHHFGYVY